MKRFFGAAIPFATLCLAQPLAASGFHDLPAIDRQVAAFTGAEIGQPGGPRAPVDAKMRLRACTVPLDLSWHGARQEAVLVRCPQADGWRIFVPVVQHGGAAAAQVLVNRRDIVRVEAGGPGFAVSRTGEALEDGAAGDWIRVRFNDDRRNSKVVSGEVLVDGRVRVAIR